eukprot:TRINITY_DN28757_c0_g1_i1.p1 TRINITY_DN28757_c0_g1~~TRINITY_DN28757_c0_g1_i1.p1  ORF type:complete len:213 (+),score=39.83 TRINITY_DN28757_c0_g1_i1:55-693(+)
MVLSVGLMPDEVLVLIMQAHSGKTDTRALAPRCRKLVDANFEIRHVRPPNGKSFVIDFEVDVHESKHLYCAQFGHPCQAVEDEDFAGSVTFAKWLPAYLRSKVQQEVVHSLQESDGCALWKFISKVRSQRERASSEDSVDSSASTASVTSSGSFATCSKAGHLTVCEGKTQESMENRREVIGRLSVVETDMLLSVLDHRRNSQARKMEVAIS